MKTDYVEKLATLMKADAEGLRSARMPQDQVRKIYRKAHRAKWLVRIAGLLFFGTLFGVDLVRDDKTPLADKLDTAMCFICVGAIGVCAVKKRSAEYTSEVAVVMSRRLAEIEKERG